jgi:nitrate reductase delta subunit
MGRDPSLLGSSKIGSFGFASTQKGPEHAVAAERIREWTRARFALPEDAAVMVAEVTCAVPGCPPLETVVAFWTGNEQRHYFKVFTPLTEVAEEDLPPAWLKNALADVEGFGCECC